MWTLTDDTARFLNDKRSQAGYDEYLRIGCNAFFDSYANASISEGREALASALLIDEAHGNRCPHPSGSSHHASTEEAARTLGFLHLTKGGQTSSDSDRVFAELAHERFCRPRPTVVSGPVDELR
jgi:hypothetical protein